VATQEKLSDSKGINAETVMQYTTGDRLKLTGISGNYSTVTTDVPATGKTITFNFIACTDGDGNNYPIVQIGTAKGTNDNLDPAEKKGALTWMGENLKTTKYRNGVVIGTTIPYNKDISGESTPKYQWPYNGNDNNVVTYGRLYTWYAATDSLYICPTGWRLPLDAEWTIFEDYLIANGYNYDGTTTGNKIAKALASTTLWTSDTDVGTVGNTDYPAKRNACGLTALPGGYRDYAGTFYAIGNFGRWWSATEFITTFSWNRGLNYNISDVNRGTSSKKDGLSVRCVKD
jgi:uncharacterized protein (TIGR02145 family)